MKKYVKKPPTVEAHQLTEADFENPPDIKGVIFYTSHVRVAGSSVAIAGDWIVLTRSGDLTVMSDVLFRSLYEVPE